MAEPNIFTVIPVYNGQETIKNVVSNLSHYLPLNHIVVVDDGSTDNTGLELNSFNELIRLNHASNRGKGAALRTGITYALSKHAQFIFTIDADEQHDPAEIPNFLMAIAASDADIILGSRMKNLKDMPMYRILSNKISSYLISIKLKKRVEDSQSGFRLYKAGIFKNLQLVCDYFDFETEVLLKAGRKGYKFGEIDIATIYPQNIVSAIKIKDVFRFIKLYFSV